MPKVTYEVETRFHFSNPTEAFRIIPFLQSNLTQPSHWRTIHYGRALMAQDEIIRIGFVDKGVGERVYLGWKGADRGRLINIRPELDEEISAGIKQSTILKQIGGVADQTSVEAIQTELVRLGYDEFMSFIGENQVGFYEPLQLHLKLMHCQTLRYPWLVEFEKTAQTPDEIGKREAELLEIVRLYGLNERLVRAEPPTLLWQTLAKRA